MAAAEQLSGWARTHGRCCRCLLCSSGSKWLQAPLLSRCCADPDFRQPLVVTYEFERLQPCRLVVYDVDTRAGDVSKLRLEQQDFLGEAPAMDRCPPVPQ